MSTTEHTSAEAATILGTIPQRIREWADRLQLGRRIGAARILILTADEVEQIRPRIGQPRGRRWPAKQKPEASGQGGKGTPD